MDKEIAVLKVIQKVRYIVRSSWATFQNEGIIRLFLRAFSFLVYGKGVLNVREYEKRRKDFDALHGITLSDAIHCLSGAEGEDYTKERWKFRMVDIVIPIYNGMQFLPALFESVLKNSDIPHRLIVVDDASSDVNVWPFLEEMKEKFGEERMILLKNKKNLGFVETVNKAVGYTKNHFVLLNSDTEVPREWLSRLMLPIFENKNIASVTPFSNSATIFSFPIPQQDNDLLTGYSLSEIDAAFRLVSGSRNRIAVPTGMGFCMGINKEVANEIGMFDAEKFGRGFAEENDWCQRAIKRGYRNIVAPNVFVYHKHCASFDSEEKKQLIEKNLKTLTETYPGYHKDVHDFIVKDPFKKIRDIVLFLILANPKNEPDRPILVFNHLLGGGSADFMTRDMQNRVQRGAQILEVSYDARRSEYFLAFYSGPHTIRYRFSDWKEFDDLFQYFAIQKVEVNHIISFKYPLETISWIDRVRRNRGVPVKLYLHDYYAICPNYTLVNELGSYCGIPNLPNELSRCTTCLSKTRTQYTLYTPGKVDIMQWRKTWGHFLLNLDEIVCFSESSKNILLRAYPQLTSRSLIVRPHEVNYLDEIWKGPRRRNSNEPLNVGVLGGINFVKGASLLKELALIIKKGEINMQIVIIGEYVEKQKHKNITVTGKFQLKDIAHLTKKYKIDIFFIPSIWPETFSFTAEEVMQMGYPLIVFDIGAPAERVRRYKRGIIVSEVSAQLAYKALQKYNEKLKI